MQHPLLIVSQSDHLIHVVDTSSNTEWQTVQIQISWLLHLGSAGLGLIHSILEKKKKKKKKKKKTADDILKYSFFPENRH